ncbi:hypothetical protein Pfo_031430, partial [Paulownia fortunei]
IFLIQVLQPPKAVLHTIEQIMEKKFWGSYGEHRRLHWASWDTICYPIEEGGLGIRKLSDVVQPSHLNFVEIQRFIFLVGFIHASKILWLYLSGCCQSFYP